ncbi:hypothetical protein FDUTEX481_10093 [Tolypothrix sp. PCC 7601]|nr:hypothetical protein FDUTEX481_10093 [Tolypothrix sp. PCC 7601]
MQSLLKHLDYILARSRLLMTKVFNSSIVLFAECGCDRILTKPILY